MCSFVLSAHYYSSDSLKDPLKAKSHRFNASHPLLVVVHMHDNRGSHKEHIRLAGSTATKVAKSKYSESIDTPRRPTERCEAPYV